MSAPDTISFIVKVCGITNEEDARVAIEAGANALGFNFYPRSPRYVTPARAREIVRSLPASFLKVGVFVNASEPELMQTAAEVPLDVLQLHGDSCPPQVFNSYRVWKSTNAGNIGSVALPPAEAYLLDTPSPAYGGSGQCFDWPLAAAFPHRKIRPFYEHCLRFPWTGRSAGWHGKRHYKERRRQQWLMRLTLR